MGFKSVKVEEMTAAGNKSSSEVKAEESVPKGWGSKLYEVSIAEFKRHLEQCLNEIQRLLMDFKKGYWRNEKCKSGE